VINRSRTSVSPSRSCVSAGAATLGVSRERVASRGGGIQYRHEIRTPGDQLETFKVDARDEATSMLV
jgi:hypothetical protein